MPYEKNAANKKYIVNHNLGKIITPDGNCFNFSDCVTNFDFPVFREDKLVLSAIEGNFPNINLKIVSLSQLEALEEYILNNGFNPVFSIEFGEIIHPADLCKKSAVEIMNRANDFCRKYDINLKYSIPKELIARDFSRVFDMAKDICKQIKPHSVVINNEDFFNNFICDNEMKKIKIEIGSGLYVKKQNNLSFMKDFVQIHCVDLSEISNLEDIKTSIKNIEKFVPKRKITVCGSIPVKSEGLCPLNTLPPEQSRINCNAACQKGHYAIKDCCTNNVYPFMSDGFCRMHLYEDKILDLSSYVKSFEKIGINEFTLDMSILKEDFVSVLLTRFINKQNAAIFKELKTIPKDTL